jgi:hypothetical protein
MSGFCLLTTFASLIWEGPYKYIYVIILFMLYVSSLFLFNRVCSPEEVPLICADCRCISRNHYLPLGSGPTARTRFFTASLFELNVDFDFRFRARLE